MRSGRRRGGAGCFRRLAGCFSLICRGRRGGRRGGGGERELTSRLGVPRVVLNPASCRRRCLTGRAAGAGRMDGRTGRNNLRRAWPSIAQAPPHPRPCTGLHAPVQVFVGQPQSGVRSDGEARRPLARSRPNYRSAAPVNMCRASASLIRGPSSQVGAPGLVPMQRAARRHSAPRGFRHWRRAIHAACQQLPLPPTPRCCR